MGIIWTIIVGIHLCSLLFLTIYLQRVFHYIHRYKMPESRFTLLFGLIGLPHILFAYILTVAIFSLGTLLLVPLMSSA